MDLGTLTLKLTEALGLSSLGRWWFAFIQSFIVLGLFAFVYVPLERAWRAREQKLFRPGWLTDLAFFFGQYWVFGLLSAVVLGHVHAVLGDLAPAWFSRWPGAVQALVAIGLGDLCVYWAHRAQHRFSILWRFHAVHHSAEHLDWLAAHREHPLDGIYTQLAVNLPAMLLGFSMGSIFWLITLRGMWSILIHSNTKLPLGPFKYLLGSPAFHHWHHAKERHAPNYGNLSPWADIVFGTHANPPEPPRELGLAEPCAASYWGLLVKPFSRPRAKPPSARS